MNNFDWIQTELFMRGEGEGGNVCFHSKHPQANASQKLCSTTLIAPVVCSCEPTVPGDFAKVTKNDTQSKPFFSFSVTYSCQPWENRDLLV